jgi:excisionase family DNA binding protein
MQTNEKLAYSTKEAAQLLSVSEKTIRRLIKEKRLLAIKIGSRRLLVPRAAVLRLLENEAPAGGPGGGKGAKPFDLR